MDFAVEYKFVWNPLKNIASRHLQYILLYKKIIEDNYLKEILWDVEQVTPKDIICTIAIQGNKYVQISTMAM